MRKAVSSLLVVLVVTVPLVGAIAAVAYAADLCLSLGFASGQHPFQTKIVVKNVGGGNTLKFPQPGKCLSLSGFAVNDDSLVPLPDPQCKGCNFPGGSFPTPEIFGTMSLCSSSDKSHVTVVSNFPGVSVHTRIPLPIPGVPTDNASSDGIVTSADVATAVTTFGIPTTAGVCSPSKITVP